VRSQQLPSELASSVWIVTHIAAFCFLVGGADDWAKGAAGIKYAYTVELRDDGTYGFLLPATQIVPTGKETFAAIKAIAKAIVCKI
jgi:hypothetical protein